MIIHYIAAAVSIFCGLMLAVGFIKIANNTFESEQIMFAFLLMIILSIAAPFI